MATTTPIYGFDVPTSTDYVKDGATAIETLGDDVDAFLGTAFNSKLHPGLVLVKTQTIGSGVSSVTMTGAFSATYDDYLIEVTGGSNSADGSLRITLGGITTGYYSILFYATFAGGSPAGASNTNSGNFEWVGGGSPNGLHMDLRLKNPFNAKYTTGTANYLVASTSGQIGYTQIMNTNATSATAFTITPSTGTMTGGTIAVYGYAKD